MTATATAPYVPVPEIITAKDFVLEVAIVAHRTLSYLPMTERLFAIAEAHDPYQPKSGSLLPAIANALHQIVTHPSYTDMPPVQTFRLTMALALRLQPQQLESARIVVMR